MKFPQFPYEQLGGRFMAMAWAILTLGTGLQIAGKLDGTYLALLAIVQGLVGARAVAQDMVNKKNGAGLTHP